MVAPRIQPKGLRSEQVARTTNQKDLKAHSKAKTPAVKVSKLMKRSVGSLRAKAHTLGIGLGHQR